MNRTFHDEAIVLHAYDIGEADRLCILFVKSKGKMAVRVSGARKILSRKGGSLLPLQRIRVQCRRSSAGYHAESTEIIALHGACRSNMESFTAALQGIEYILRMIEDEHPLPEVYDLCSRYLDACDRRFHPALPSLYVLALFDTLGTLPSFDHSVVTHRPIDRGGDIGFSPKRGGVCIVGEVPDAIRLPQNMLKILRGARSIDFHTLPPLDASSLQAMMSVAHSIVGSQLGSPVKSLAVSRAISSSVAPTW